MYSLFNGIEHYREEAFLKRFVQKTRQKVTLITRLQAEPGSKLATRLDYNSVLSKPKENSLTEDVVKKARAVSLVK